jgi:hypothetical protein
MKGMLPDEFVYDRDDEAEDDRQNYRAADRKIEPEIILLNPDVKRQVAKPPEQAASSGFLGIHDKQTENGDRCTDKNQHFSH